MPLGVDRPESGQPVTQGGIVVARPQVGLESPAQGTELQRSLGAQRPLAGVVQISLDHAVVTVGGERQLAQCDVAVTEPHRSLLPAHCGVQRHRPTGPQDGSRDMHLQCAAWNAERRDA